MIRKEKEDERDKGDCATGMIKLIARISSIFMPKPSPYRFRVGSIIAAQTLKPLFGDGRMITSYKHARSHTCNGPMRDSHRVQPNQPTSTMLMVLPVGRRTASRT